MKDTVTVRASLRTPGHPRQIRQEGYVPVILYGRNTDTVALKVTESEMSRVMVAGGERGLLNLSIEDAGDGERVVMVREIQRDPVERTILHVDLYQVDLDQKITTSVPLNLLGEEEATSGIGVLQHGIRELEVQCLPGDIPENISVDISWLELGDSITVSDVDVPENVEVLSEPTETIVTLVQPRLEVDEPEEEEDLLDEDLEPELVGEEEEEETEEGRPEPEQY